eukprot:6937326-Prymnesium_polylepis.1
MLAEAWKLAQARSWKARKIEERSPSQRPTMRLLELVAHEIELLDVCVRMGLQELSLRLEAEPKRCR